MFLVMKRLSDLLLASHVKILYSIRNIVITLHCLKHLETVKTHLVILKRTDYLLLIHMLSLIILHFHFRNCCQQSFIQRDSPSLGCGHQTKRKCISTGKEKRDQSSASFLPSSENQNNSAAV